MQQLMDGVRFLDVRLRVSGDELLSTSLIHSHNRIEIDIEKYTTVQDLNDHPSVSSSAPSTNSSPAILPKPFCYVSKKNHLHFTPISRPWSTGHSSHIYTNGSWRIEYQR